VASQLASGPGWEDHLLGDRRQLSKWAPRVAQLAEDASREEVFAALWANVVEAALAAAPDRMLFLGHHRLVDHTDEALDAVAGHFGLRESWDFKAAVSELTYYAKSKNPAERFEPGGRHSRPPLPARTLERVLEIAGDVQQRLDARALSPASL
jgi:hypothetical protein